MTTTLPDWIGCSVEEGLRRSAVYMAFLKLPSEDLERLTKLLNHYAGKKKLTPEIMRMMNHGDLLDCLRILGKVCVLRDVEMQRLGYGTTGKLLKAAAGLPMELKQIVARILTALKGD